MIFDSSDQLTPDDTDFDEDIYDRSGGQAMLVSPAPLVPCPDPSPLDGGLASEDGQRVLFPTDERLVPEDTDCEFDIYMRTAGATTLLSVGPTAGNGPGRVTGGVFSDDGTRVFFLTNEQLVAQDTDLVLDVYERSGTTTTLISAGGVNGNGAFDSSPRKGRCQRRPCLLLQQRAARPAGHRRRPRPLRAPWRGDLACFHRPGRRQQWPGGLARRLLGVPRVRRRHSRLLRDNRAARVLRQRQLRDVYMARAGAGGYPRPRGATPVHVPLVPALAPCASPNRTHGPPLAFGSCAPPVQSSGHLTVGTPDANGAASNSAGYLQLNVLVGAGGPPEDSDVLVDFSITDVRCRAGVSACGTANTAGGADYTGQLEATVRCG